jgi:quercetin 2,3-dioxygenase
MGSPRAYRHNGGMDNAISRPRSVERLVAGQAAVSGAGVKLTRLFTQDLQPRLDPFLMLADFGSDDPDDYRAGFPDHPHRGFETVTYMSAGRLRHRDSAGHEGLLQGGGVQWMTAGRGLVHSEMPEGEDGTRMAGYQLWLNLPSRSKLCEPGYRDIPSAEIPESTTPDGVTVRVIAGQAQGLVGAVQREGTEPLYLDLHLPAGASLQQPIPAGHNAFLYVYSGPLEVLRPGGDATQVPSKRMAILSNDGDGVSLHAPGAARALLIAGRPLREPIAQYGPFVMNTRDELIQAVEDFQNGRFT